MAILPMECDMDIMRAVSQHPAEPREIGEPGQKRAGDMRKTEVGLYGMKKHH